MDETGRTSYLAALSPGDDIDHRGTVFTQELLSELLDALLDPASKSPRIGNADFEEATFTDDSGFYGVTFTGDANFSDASFAGLADFGGVTFTGDADFLDASFAGDARFGSASFAGNAQFGAAFAGEARFDVVTFSRAATFSSATFARSAWFGGATFTGEASFGEALFAGDARFGGATFVEQAEFIDAVFGGKSKFSDARFTEDVRFDGSRFDTSRSLGPLVCGGTVHLDGAEFGAPVTVEIASVRVSLRRTRWESTAALRLRYAAVDLAGAMLEHPMTLLTYPTCFISLVDDYLADDVLTGRDVKVQITSLAGVNAAHLTLTDVDLTGCGSAGVVHLDQLRLEDTTNGGQSVGTQNAPPRS
ncbi:pentapeptide repeat-containing protein [Streptomyces sp. NPDC002795]|uniref:pentapeptide repeat-containing protein n=1 Tax=Streptomyces sp. NPDC002795 TaxID=3364665 RepID=UPI0036A0D936